MGVLVFLLAIVPLSGGSNINLMRAESPGPSVGKLVPKMKYTARILYIIYFGLTLIQFILLIIGRMPVFDAVCTAFGTAGTGGFESKMTALQATPHISSGLQPFSCCCSVSISMPIILFYSVMQKSLQNGGSPLVFYCCHRFRSNNNH